MTPQEAINHGKEQLEIFGGEHREFIEMAIKALEQQPTRCDSCTHFEEQDGSNCYECVKGMADNFEAQPCEDCISRDAVLDEIDKYIKKAQSTGIKDDFISFEELVVKQLPSVTPQQKVGTWEYVQYDGNPNIGNWHCSKCRGICIGMHSLEDAYDFCPNCGAKMESEAKE